MYALINARLASMEELKSWYTLDEALKLYSIYQMNADIQRGQQHDADAEMNRNRR